MSNQELVISNQGKVKNFRELKAWQIAYDLAIEIYLVTKKFPREELYGLVSQMRRAAISVTANIAEGFGRYHYKEKMQFYYMARGSITELESELLVAKGIGYIGEDEVKEFAGKFLEVGKLINGLISSAQKRSK